MQNYNVEDLKFYNMETRDESVFFLRGKTTVTIFEIEDTLGTEDKIDFIDSLENGAATYMLKLIEKWESEKSSLPQDSYGNPKTVSKKAWIKRNDSKGIVDVNFSVGSYNLLGKKYNQMESTLSESQYKEAFEGKHIVHSWFHKLCTNLYHKETVYFKENDPKSKNISKVKEYGKIYGTLNNRIVNDIIWNSLEDVSNEQLDAILKAFKSVELVVQKESLLLDSAIGGKFEDTDED